MRSLPREFLRFDGRGRNVVRWTFARLHGESRSRQDWALLPQIPSNLRLQRLVYGESLRVRQVRRGHRLRAARGEKVSNLQKARPEPGSGLRHVAEGPASGSRGWWLQWQVDHPAGSMSQIPCSYGSVRSRLSNLQVKWLLITENGP